MTFCACVTNAPMKSHNQKQPKQEFDSIMNTSNTKAKEPRDIRSTFARKTAVICFNLDYGALILTRFGTIHIANVVRAFAQRTLKQENRWLRHQVESPDRGGISVVAEREVSDTSIKRSQALGELYPEAQQVLACLEREREAARRAADVGAGKYVEDWFEVGGDRGRGG